MTKETIAQRLDLYRKRSEEAEKFLLDLYGPSGNFVLSVAQNYNEMVLHQRELAATLQNQVGDDVVVLYAGRAFVPFVGPAGHPGYEIHPVYDLDADLIDLGADAAAT